METDGTAGAPDQGAPDQGTADSTGGLFDSYLQAVPEDARETVTGYLKDAEKHLNSRLMEAADLSSRFGPYKDIDLSRVPPQQLSQVLDWYSTVGANPEAYQEWLREAATEAGILSPQEQETADPGEQDIEQIIQQQVAQALQPFQQQLSQKEEAEKVQQMESHIVSTLGKIEADNKITLTDEQKEAILALGEQHEGDDWVEQGFAKFQSIAGNAQAALVKGKAGQPATPLSTGGTAAPKAPVNFAEAGEQALERLRQSLAS